MDFILQPPEKTRPEKIRQDRTGPGNTGQGKPKPAAHNDFKWFSQNVCESAWDVQVRLARSKRKQHNGNFRRQQSGMKIERGQFLYRRDANVGCE